MMRRARAPVSGLAVSTLIVKDRRDWGRFRGKACAVTRAKTIWMLVISVCVIVSVPAAVVQSAKGGLWSDSRTWTGRAVPGVGDEVVIGPEGDFSATETARAVQKGIEPVSLGDITLRVETAVLFALSVLNYTSRRYIFGISFPVRYTCLSSAVFFSDDHT